MPIKKGAFIKNINNGNFEELNLSQTPKINGLREYINFLEDLDKNYLKTEIETNKTKTNN